MPDFDINIVLKDGRAVGKIRQVRSELSKTEKQANRTRGAFRGLFAGISTALAVREFISLSNVTVEIENRLKLVEDTVGDTEVAFQRLADISRKTRSPLQENVALFQRAAQAQKELGATNEELFDFVQATGTALAIQGGSAQTARGALIQLSQAIGATVVRAEEFNSILEGALPLAQAAARGIDEAGGSVAKLRQLVISGEISSSEFFRAIVEQAEFLEEQFANTTPTIAQAFTVMRTEAIATFRVFNEGTGITTILANSIIFLAQNLETLARILAVGAVFFGLIKGTQLAILAIGLLSKAVIGLVALLATVSGPFILIGGAIAAVIALVVGFGDKIKITAQGATALDLFVAIFQAIGRAIDKAITKIGEWVGGIEGGMDLAGQAVLGFVTFFAKGIDILSAAWNATMDTIVAIAGSGWRGIAELFIIQIRFIATKFEDLINLFVKGLNLFRDEAIEEFNVMGETFDRLSAEYGVESGKIWNESFAQGLSQGPAAAALAGFLAQANARAFARAEDLAFSQPVLPPSPEAGSSSGRLGKIGGGGSKSTFADIVEEYEKGIDALQLLGAEQREYNAILKASDKIGRDLTQTEQDQIKALLEKTEVLQKASDIYDDINSRVDDYIRTQQAINSLLERGAISDTEADFALQQSDLVQDLRDVDSSLGGAFDFAAQKQAITDFTNERTIILQQARENDLLNEEEYQARLRALTGASQREILNLELDRWDLAVSSAQNSIGVLLNAAEEYAGKQSGIYKGLFLAQKAFAIAEATINTFRAISNALAAPFPPPIPQTLAAAAAVAGGAQVAAIVASTVTGLREGGQVRGPGGPRDDAAGLYALSNGEFVVNADAAKANLPLLQAINSGNNVMKGMRDGGLVATPTGLANAGSSDVNSANRSAAPSLPKLNNNVNVPVNVIAVSDEQQALNAVQEGRLDDAIIVRIGENAPAVRNSIGIEN